MIHEFGHVLRVPGYRLFSRETACACVCICLLAAGSLLAQGPAREYDIKATLLFNFSQFVEWPPNAFVSTNAPVVIGIFGSDPFGGLLDELVKNERVQGGRPIVVKRFRKPDEIQEAHILFITKPEHSRSESLIRACRGRPVLTVADAGEREFVRRGGMVAFLKQGDKLRLAVNLDAARSASLNISAKLLQVAEIHPFPKRSP